MKTFAVVFLLSSTGALASPLHAGQLPADISWIPFVGCWQLVEERSRNENVTTRACVAPTASGDAVQLTTYSSDRTETTLTLIADGRDHEVNDGGCRGTHRAEWSAGGRRLFRHANLTCTAAADRQRMSGISFLVNADTWVDIQVVGGDVQVRRFFREGQRTATHSPAAFTLDDVREAANRVDALAIEAALVESHATFALNRRVLLALDAGSVPDSVIDLMVALSYPQHFVVDRPGVPPGRISSGGGGGGSAFGLGSSAEYPFSPYDPYGYWSYFGPRSFFVYPYEYYDSALGYAAAPQPEPADGGGTSAHGRGVAVNGQGYTRVRATDDAAASSAGLNTTAVSGRLATARAAGGTFDGSSANSGSGSNDSGSSGASSGGGYSSGGSDSGRTAVPR